MKKKLVVFTFVMFAIIRLMQIICATDVNAATKIDISGLSNEELIELQEEIDQKLLENGAVDTINPGFYIVGKDIKAGTYELSSKAIELEDMTLVYVYDSKEDYDNDIDNYSLSYQVGTWNPDSSTPNEYHSVSVTLEEGNLISIEDNTCLIKPYEASWQVK